MHLLFPLFSPPPRSPLVLVHISLIFLVLASNLFFTITIPFHHHHFFSLFFLPFFLLILLFLSPHPLLLFFPSRSHPHHVTSRLFLARVLIPSVSDSCSSTHYFSPPFAPFSFSSTSLFLILVSDSFSPPLPPLFPFAFSRFFPSFWSPLVLVSRPHLSFSSLVLAQNTCLDPLILFCHHHHHLFVLSFCPCFSPHILVSSRAENTRRRPPTAIQRRARRRICTERRPETQQSRLSRRLSIPRSSRSRAAEDDRDSGIAGVAHIYVDGKGPVDW